MLNDRECVFWVFNLLLCIINIELGAADGVLGCGGFVKSDVDINFSLVEVKLYTPHGSIKYQTDCAPNTGYYLIPLYDKGDFILKVEPPKGWSFEPQSIELQVDGTNDKCSKGEDINFLFTGFSVIGKVISKGQTIGPSGVSVSLAKSNSGEIIQTVKTSDNGEYMFTKVLPGEYKVKASHQTWKLEKPESVVKVINDNGNAGNNLVISGYDVSGVVSSDGEYIKGVNFLLFSSTVKQQDVTGCEKSPLKGFTGNQASKPICYVTSQQNGRFIFPSLPTGKYYIVPFYKGEHITFDVLPEKLEFEVQHQSVQLQKQFNVAGFSVSGRVLDSEKGSGVAKAKILLNGNEQTMTSQDGTYHLENMKTGTYKLSVQSSSIYFDDITLKITPSTPQLPNIVASSFSLCGQVIIDRLPEALSSVPSQRRIIYHPDGKKSEAVSLSPEADGKFCTKVKPGKYIIGIHLSEQEVKAGLHLSPAEQVVTVTNKPIKDIRFSQFRAKVSGTVVCMEKCGNIDIL
ncbi:BOS complex subunit NOMO1 [Patella vulgata]|uniref:BOS complex subunit NOMO1 n=1 Tax=Patella vulgata TaxID=6465 RepID=UPI00217F2D1D|nr:BOS complex subunit NOMO1 [Patella vulgata]